LDTQVIIVGAGPAGLTLALDLAQRGVRSILIERGVEPIQLPKMERCNARTMEIFRRLGIAKQVRAAGLRADAPLDVFLAFSMSDPKPLAHLPCPSAASAAADIAAHNDGRPLEPDQLISQYTLEPLLRDVVGKQPNVLARFGCELLSFDQRNGTVTAQVRDGKGRSEMLRAKFLVGCDGGSSTVRKQLGIKLEGQGRIRRLWQALFYAPDLYDRIPMGTGRHYHIATGPLFPFVILQDSTRHWTLHAAAEGREQMPALFQAAIGAPTAFEMLSANEWSHNLLCAERYRDGNVFIAGDAAHLVIPTGGLGMNTGVGDAIDLSWKLAGVLAGWGGRELLNAYEAERRPIGLRNVEASRGAMNGRLAWRAAYSPDVVDASRDGGAARAAMGQIFDAEQRKVTEILGIECGYRYVGSPLTSDEPGGPDANSRAYVPTSWPGARLPHVWLDDGTPIHDRLGTTYSLLRFGRTLAETEPLERALRATGAPLDVIELTSSQARAIYEYDYLLVRPDLHVVWRGNAPPADPQQLARIATGRLRRAG
jgi:2-polyprenyl-6-methoxyphenol hydroxylase-like FAD-dependent oxidoreductase